ncbi:hypothetical protein LJC29_08100, partial [Bacteroides sp. OttesenSCG-928-N06]|nr:hypothetical protein [Bacteroides sp. OttesenSCG-928-N06]
AGVKPNFYVGQIQVALNSFCPKGWRVPTLEELKCIYENRDNIGGFDNREVYYSDEIYTGVLYIGFYGVNFKKDGEEKKIKKSGNLRCVKDIVQ